MDNEETTVDNTDTVVEDQNQEAVVEPKANEELDAVKAQNDKLEKELGGLKRDLKKATKKKDDGKTEQAEPNEVLLKKADTAILIADGIKEDDETELAFDTAKKWDMPVEKLIKDEDFQVKLKKLRDTKANELATSDLKGGGSNNVQAKNTTEYWDAKIKSGGAPPTREDIPNDKARKKINRELLNLNKPSGKLSFYNSK